MPTPFIHTSGSYTDFIPWGKLGGVWYECKIGWINQQGIWKKFYTKVETRTLTTQNNVTLQSLFTNEIWTDQYIQKKVVVPSGVTIGSTNSQYAIRTGSSAGWAGDLILEIQSGGFVQGIGGAANSGTGGSVIWGNYNSTTGQNLIVNNYGTTRAGGGGGGQGGNGGTGVWYSGRTVSEGPMYHATQYFWQRTTQLAFAQWGGVSVGSTGRNETQLSAGGWVYYRGVEILTDVYNISRSTTIYDVPNYTSGGAGGAGGRGQGHDGGAAGGSAGGAGGTNAGQGGTGGTGGTWGATGGTGATGNSGNYGGGSGGYTGGLAGYYKYGYVTFNNYNTALGRAG